MTPYYEDRWITIYEGDAREVMRAMPAESVDAIVTSPPYWGLRDYSIPPSVWGGDPSHDHDWTPLQSTEWAWDGKTRWQHRLNGQGLERKVERKRVHLSLGEACECGAWRGPLGLEPTVQQYVANLVAVMEEARRVLKRTGTVWLNLGDSYAGRAHGRSAVEGSSDGGVGRGQRPPPRRTAVGGLKPKDLVGAPWRAALALQDAGWYLRSDVVWHKPNGMPESVHDRPRHEHEYVFLLSKGRHYYWGEADIAIPYRSSPSDLRKIAEGRDRIGGKAVQNADPRHAANHASRIGRKRGVGNPEAAAAALRGETVGARPPGTVWSIQTVPYPGAHFATFPPALAERCVLASTPPNGIVLDPFAGTGTVGAAAQAHGRRSVLIDLNPEYLEQQVRRAVRAWGASKLVDKETEPPEGSIWSLL